MNPDNLFRWLAVYRQLGKPIPRYPKGIDHADKGPAMIGESGPEIVHGPTCSNIVGKIKIESCEKYINVGRINAGSRIEVRRSNNPHLVKYGEVQEDGSVFLKGSFDKALGASNIRHLATNIKVDTVFDYLHKEREQRLMKEAREMAERILYPRSTQEEVFNRVRAKYAYRWMMKDA